MKTLLPEKIVKMLVEHSEALGGTLTFETPPYDYQDHPKREFRTWFQD